VKPAKNKQKPGLKSRISLRISMKAVLLISTGIFTMTALGLVIVNMTNPHSSQARANETIEVVKVSDQEFTNEMSLENPVIIQEKINGEHAILIREKKVVNAQ
jgi:phosphohistidine swiveling domain-containing protein